MAINHFAMSYLGTVKSLTSNINSLYKCAHIMCVCFFLSKYIHLMTDCGMCSVTFTL